MFTARAGREASPLRLLALLAPPCLLAAAGQAQTWDGGGVDNNWTTIANWNPDGLPANNGTANIIGSAASLTQVVN